MSFSTLHTSPITIHLDGTTMKSVVSTTDFRELVYEVSPKSSLSTLKQALEDSDASTASCSLPCDVTSIGSSSISAKSAEDDETMRQGRNTMTNKNTKKRFSAKFSISKNSKKLSLHRRSSSTSSQSESKPASPLSSKIRAGAAASAVAVRKAPKKVLKSLKKTKLPFRKSNHQEDDNSMVLSETDTIHDFHVSGSLVTGRLSLESCPGVHPNHTIAETKSSQNAEDTEGENEYAFQESTKTSASKQKKMKNGNKSKKKKKKKFKKLASKVFKSIAGHSKKSASSSSSSKTSHDTSVTSVMEMTTSSTSQEKQLRSTTMTSSAAVGDTSDTSVTVNRCTTTPLVLTAPVDHFAIEGPLPGSTAFVRSVWLDQSVVPKTNHDAQTTIRCQPQKPKKVLNISKNNRRKMKQVMKTMMQTPPMEVVVERTSTDITATSVDTKPQQVLETKVDESQRARTFSPLSYFPLLSLQKWLLTATLMLVLFLSYQHSFELEEAGIRQVADWAKRTPPLVDVSSQTEPFFAYFDGLDIPTINELVVEPIEAEHKIFWTGQLSPLLQESMPFAWA